ncbi:Rossmann-like and DUF2520 domain-containing protein [Chromobacterium fluminis]|nr:Rossmann-like and DUF2520 domain-containing protein [Chromobacterium haemolyticum]
MNIIGAGRLGKTLAALARRSGRYSVRDVMTRNADSAAAACAFIGAGRPVTEWADLSAADLYLLAVPDAAIADCAQRLAAAGVPSGAVVFHASGVSGSELLRPAAARGAHVGSLHPAFSFADPAVALEGFSEVLCALEGDAEACLALRELAQAIGGRPFQLADGGKPAYHAALSVASNYLVTLIAIARRLASQGGVSEELLTPLLGGLMRQTLGNALALGPQEALTGPIARGDASTVALHLQAMDDGELRAVYQALGRQTVALVGDGLSEQARRQVLSALASAEGSDR